MPPVYSLFFFVMEYVSPRLKIKITVAHGDGGLHGRLLERFQTANLSSNLVRGVRFILSFKAVRRQVIG